jgi:hypothetical protein
MRAVLCGLRLDFAFAATRNFVLVLARTCDGTNMTDLVKLFVASQHNSVVNTPTSLYLMTAILRSARSTTSRPVLELYNTVVTRACEFVCAHKAAQGTMNLFDAMCFAITELPPPTSSSRLRIVFTPTVLTGMLNIASGFAQSAPTYPSDGRVDAISTLVESFVPKPRDDGYAVLVDDSGLLPACTKLLETVAAEDSTVIRFNRLLELLVWLLGGDKNHAARCKSVMDTILDSNVVHILARAFVRIGPPFGPPAAPPAAPDDVRKVSNFFETAADVLNHVRPTKGVSAAQDPTSTRFIAQVVPHLPALVQRARIEEKCIYIKVLAILAKQGLFGQLGTDASRRVVDTMMDVVRQERFNTKRSNTALCVLQEAPPEIMRQFAERVPEFVSRLSALPIGMPGCNGFTGFILFMFKSCSGTCNGTCNGTDEARQVISDLMGFLEKHTCKIAAANLNTLFKMAYEIGKEAPSMKDRLVVWCQTVTQVNNAKVPSWLQKLLALSPSKRKTDDSKTTATATATTTAGEGAPTKRNKGDKTPSKRRIGNFTKEEEEEASTKRQKGTDEEDTDDDDDDEQ